MRSRRSGGQESRRRPRRCERMAARRTTIRWDRLGRLALLATLFVILLLYISPAKHWLQQSSTAGAQRQDLEELTKENRPARASGQAAAGPRRPGARGTPARHGARRRARLRDRGPAALRTRALGVPAVPSDIATFLQGPPVREESAALGAPVRLARSAAREGRAPRGRSGRRQRRRRPRRPCPRRGGRRARRPSRCWRSRGRRARLAGSSTRAAYAAPPTRSSPRDPGRPARARPCSPAGARRRATGRGRSRWSGHPAPRM